MNTAKEWRPTRSDLGVAFLVGVFGIFDSLTSDHNNLLGDRRGEAALVVALAAVALVGRRRWPAAVAAVSAVAHALANDPVQLIVALYSAGYHERSPVRLAGVTAFAVGLRATTLAETAGPSGVRLLLYGVVAFGGAALCGLMFCRYSAAVSDREGSLARERARSVDEARSQERARIAREMHDVVAHRVSLIVVEAGALEAAAGRGTNWTVTVARRIQVTGRTALDELRQIIGVLAPRAGGGSAPLAPQPGLGAVDALVGSFRDAGMDVAFAVRGTRRSLPTAAERTAFRVVQESLTNVLKHAEGSPVRVVLEYRKDSLTIRVTNDPPPRTGPGIPGSGAGLAGLGERLSLLGGKLAARPLGDGGFGVIAVIPLDEVPWDSRLPGEDE